MYRKKIVSLPLYRSLQWRKKKTKNTVSTNESCQNSRKDPKHTPEKTIWTHKIPTRRNFSPTKYSRKKNFGPTKYTREIIFDPRTNHKKKFRTHEIPTKARWHDHTRSTRPTMAHDPLNLAYSNITYINTVLGITN